MATRMSRQVERGAAVVITVDGQPVSAHAGETLATVLLAEGITTFNVTRSGKPRGPYCNMGTCFECQVKVASGEGNSWRWLRACMLPVEQGMRVVTGAQLHSLEGDDHRR